MTTDKARPPSARRTDSYVIALANQKGGVGKTTGALAFAAVTADSNGRALVCDVDPQKSAYSLSEQMTDPGYDYVHENDPLVLGKIRTVREYDAIYVDCPGSLEGYDVLRTVLQNADYIVIPYDHEPLSVEPTIRTARYIERYGDGKPYRVLLNNIDGRYGAEFIEDAWATLDQAKVPYFRSFVRKYRDYSHALRDGSTIMQYRGRNSAAVRDDVRRAHTELLYDLGRHA